MCMGWGIGELLIHSQAMVSPRFTISSGATSIMSSMLYTRPLMVHTMRCIASTKGRGLAKLGTLPEPYLTERAGILLLTRAGLLDALRPTLTVRMFMAAPLA